jgi:hypothetical protein
MDIAGSVADLADRQRVAEAYSQGAVSLFSDSFYDNCSDKFPATMRFYVPDNAVHINQVLLNAQAAAFRGYTQATQGGGSRTDTTGSGGGSQQTSEAGGSTRQTSGSGGGTRQTSAAATLNTSNTYNSYDNGGNGGQNHNHGLARGTPLATTDGNKVTGSVYWEPSGAHSHGSHKHAVNIPSHDHDVDIPDHKHKFSIPNHQHELTLPDHTHTITSGIYTGDTASKLTLRVDDILLGTYEKSINNLDIAQQMSKDDAGRIRRGWHTITITPDKLTRVECDLSVQLFANSRGGGQY